MVLWDILQELGTARQTQKRSDQRYIGFFWESPSNYPVIKVLKQNGMFGGFFFFSLSPFFV